MAGQDELARSLLERLATDPAARAEFRRDPEGAARRAGLTGLADELRSAGGDPFQTLELRESRSSLAGVAMAAAVEGLALSSADDAIAAVHGHGHERAADPAAYGMDGHGGAATAETLELLHNHRVTLDADGIADLQAGRIDARVVSLLNDLSREHTITVSAMCSDHPKLTAGGSVSNHFVGRAVDIAVIDGKPVGPGNEVAKQIARRLATMDPAIRPTEIGSPWALPGPAYFTDAGHQNHLHIGYDDPIAPGWHDEHAPPPSAVEVDDDDDESGDSDDTDDSDDSDDTDDSDDSDEREDGGSGDTEAEADEESDGDEEDDDEDDEDEDEDDEDEDEDDEDDEEPDYDDGADEPEGGGSQDDEGPDYDDGTDQADGGSAIEPPNDAGGAVAGYPGDDAPPARIAAWMGERARKRGLPPELPVMAALVESGLSNLDGGDADSVGYFQMRLGIWNQGDYAGYPERPKLQLDWFLDHAEAVKAQRLAAGLPVDDPKQYGEWIADVERPAEQYRGRYQLRLDDARELLSALGHDRGAPPGGDPDQVVKLRVITREEAARAKAAGGG